MFSPNYGWMWYACAPWWSNKRFCRPIYTQNSEYLPLFAIALYLDHVQMEEDVQLILELEQQEEVERQREAQFEENLRQKMKEKVNATCVKPLNCHCINQIIRVCTTVVILDVFFLVCVCLFPSCMSQVVT